MYRVHIDKFEGPFDLLVYLIENAKMDIYDIEVAKITEQYIDYLKEMEELDVEVASEFIVLAAVLIRLKSHMLLPRVNDIGEEIMMEDPRTELVSRLADYIQIKSIAEMLASREEEATSIHTKPAEDLSQYLNNPDEILAGSEETLVKAFLLFLQKKQKVKEVKERYQRVRSSRETLEMRIQEMVNLIELRFQTQDSFDFSELLPLKPAKSDISISFMSLLSLIKNQVVDAVQEENFGNIIISKKISAIDNNTGDNNVH